MLMVVLTWLKENGYSGDIVNAKDAINVYHVMYANGANCPVDVDAIPSTGLGS